MLRPETDLKVYQLLAADKVVRSKQVALLLRPGAGKTAATLTALKKLQAWPALVVAPARVVDANVWGEEALLWEHLEHLEIVPLTGTPSQRTDLLRDMQAHVEVVSYENLFWLTETVDLSKRYRAVVFDELSKMKHPGTKRFRRMRAAAKRISVRVGLTGTPVGNHLLDLWGEMFMVAGEEPLGPRFTDFRSKYFETVDYQERVWKLKCCPRCAQNDGKKRTCVDPRPWLGCECHQKAIRELQEAVRPYTFALAKSEKSTLAIPPVAVNRVVVPVPRGARQAMSDLRSKLVAELPNGFTLEALNSSEVAQKLRQMAGGAVYTEKDSAKWAPVHNAKLEALDDLLDELQGEPVLLFYWYQHEKERLVAHLKQRGRPTGFADEESDRRKWDAGKLEVLLAHPQSASFGLNLQEGGHTLVWYTLPFSHELWVQGCGRLARTGQRAPEVPAHVLSCGETDADTFGLLDLKREQEDALVEGLR